jgi:peptidoglycan/LPS O-acetylase OafA/YrhL
MTTTAGTPRGFMLGVLVCGLLGLVSPVLPDVELVQGEQWLIDAWALTGLLGALCAAVAFTQNSSTHAAIATGAGLGVAVGAAMFAGPHVQGPGLDLLAWLCGCVMVYASVAYLRRTKGTTSREFG